MRRASLLLCTLALVAAGCGGDEEEPSSTPAPAAEEAGGESATTNTIEDFAFEPAENTVAVGDTVEWTNEDSADHNVIFDGDKAEDIENLRQDESGTVTFEEAGEFGYVCSYHPGMKGTVVVE